MGRGNEGLSASAVRKVDLVTGACTALPILLCPPGHVVDHYTAGRLQDGRIICAGTTVTFIHPANEEESSEDEEEEEILWLRCWSRPRKARRVEPAGSGGHCLG